MIDTPPGLVRATTRTRFGWVAVAASTAGLVAITLPQADERAALARLPSPARDARLDRADSLQPALDRLRRYYAGEPVQFDDALDMGSATPFQKRVWLATRRLPRGVTTTYGDLARAIGAGPGAARAVGRCMALNPWPPLVPCHRVLGKDGSLTGFGGGVAMKRRMLEMEGAMLSLGETDSL